MCCWLFFFLILFNVQQDYIFRIYKGKCFLFHGILDDMRCKRKLRKYTKLIGIFGASVSTFTFIGICV